MAWAKCQKHVLSNYLNRPISKQVKEAVEFEAYTDLEEIDAMRQAFMDELMLRVMKMKGETAVWRAAVHPGLRPVIGKLNGPPRSPPHAARREATRPRTAPRRRT